MPLGLVGNADLPRSKKQGFESRTSQKNLCLQKYGEDQRVSPLEIFGTIRLFLDFFPNLNSLPRFLIKAGFRMSKLYFSIVQPLSMSIADKQLLHSGKIEILLGTGFSGIRVNATPSDWAKTAITRSLLLAKISFKQEV